jgi:hypothetical protein
MSISRRVRALLLARWAVTLPVPAVSETFLDRNGGADRIVTVIAFVASDTRSGSTGVCCVIAGVASNRCVGAGEQRGLRAGGFGAFFTTLIVTAHVCDRKIVVIEWAGPESYCNSQSNGRNRKKSG